MRVWEIVRLIEDSAVRATESDGLNVTFETPEGHAFQVFFDCGEPDYINWLHPMGADPKDTIHFWIDGEGRGIEALRYIAGNLLHLPHVGERLKQACMLRGFEL